MSRKHSLIKDFFEVNPAPLYFIAASGGLDSMVLIHLMLQEKLTIHVLHVNYNLRGNDSLLDAQLITDFCKKNTIPLTTKNVDLNLHLEKNGGNLQNEARKVRYSFFIEMQSKTKDSKVVIAHHQDDQIETFWIQLLRDAGISGLAGMKALNSIFLRPLLHYRKNDLLEFAQKQGIEWREDKSNSKNDYLRNRLRNEVIPFLKQEIPSINESILYLQNIFQSQILEDEELLENLKIKIQKQHQIQFSEINKLTSFQQIELFKKLSIPNFVMKEWDKLKIAQKGAKISWNEGRCMLIKEKDYFEYILESSSNKALLPKIEISNVTQLPPSFNKNTYYFDKNKILGEINIRKWEIGDRIHPIGLKGSKLISDVITDAKIPNVIRNQQFLLVDDEKILACIGLCVDKRAIASEESNEIIKVSIN